MLAVAIPLAGMPLTATRRAGSRWPGPLVFGLSFCIWLARQRRELRRDPWDTVIGCIGLGLIIPALTVATLRHLQPRLMGEASMRTTTSASSAACWASPSSRCSWEWRITVYGATPEGIDAAYSEAFILLTVTFLLATVWRCG